MNKGNQVSYQLPTYFYMKQEPNCLQQNRKSMGSMVNVKWIWEKQKLPHIKQKLPLAILPLSSICVCLCVCYYVLYTGIFWEHGRMKQTDGICSQEELQEKLGILKDRYYTNSYLLITVISTSKERMNIKINESINYR